MSAPPEPKLPAEVWCVLTYTSENAELVVAWNEEDAISIQRAAMPDDTSYQAKYARVDEDRERLVDAVLEAARNYDDNDINTVAPLCLASRALSFYDAARELRKGA